MATLSAYRSNIDFNRATSHNDGHFPREASLTDDEYARDEMLRLDYAIALALSDEEDYSGAFFGFAATLVPVLTVPHPLPTPSYPAFEESPGASSSRDAVEDVEEAVEEGEDEDDEDDNAESVDAPPSVSEIASGVSDSSPDEETSDPPHDLEDTLLLDRAIAIALAEEEDPSFSTYSHPYLSEEEYTTWLNASSASAIPDAAGASPASGTQSIYREVQEVQEDIAGPSTGFGRLVENADDVSSDKEEEEGIDDLFRTEILRTCLRIGQRLEAAEDDGEDDIARTPSLEDVEERSVHSPTLSTVIRSWKVAESIVNPEPARRELCTICCDPIVDTVIKVPCGHVFDRECLQDMFRRATTDESLFPPQCCVTEIPINLVKEHFDYSVVSAFETKAVEFSTKDRVYCYRPACSAFLGAATAERTVVKCHSCNAITCGSCKEEYRDRLHVCIPRIEESVAHLAQEQQWQRCPECHHLVELNQGCFHITCVCGSQFCYLCAAPWKECDCPQFPHQGQNF